MNVLLIIDHGERNRAGWCLQSAAITIDLAEIAAPPGGCLLK